MQEAQAVETEVRVAQVVDSVVQVANLAAGTVGAVLAVLQVAVAGLQEVMVDNFVVEEVTTVVAVEKMGASAAMEEVVKAVAAVMEAAVGVEEVALMGVWGGEQLNPQRRLRKQQVHCVIRAHVNLHRRRCLLLTRIGA